MRRAWIPLALLLASLPAAAGRVDGIAAVVDDDVILVSEVDEKANAVLERLSQRNDGPLPRALVQEVRIQAVEALIATRLILGMAERMGLEANAEEIQEAIEGIAVQEGLETEEIYAAAARQGMDREKYRKQIGEQISRMKAISAAVRPRVIVTDEEVRELYQKRYGQARKGSYAVVRHILILWPDPESGDTRETSFDIARRILEAIDEGRGFGLLAQQFSAAPSAADGGRTTFRRGEANPALEEWAFRIDPGQISAPIETEHGVNLLQLLERFESDAVSYESVEDGLRVELADRKVTPEIEEWVGELRSQVYVEVVAPDLR
jgi:peptidyl-prolyl cis-trans isomerase SurA